MTLVTHRLTDKGALVRSRAPLRLGLAGGGTDLASYSDVHGGVVLNATIDRFAYASVRLVAEPVVRMVAADMGLEETEEAASPLPIGGVTKLHRGVYNRIVREFCGGRPFGVTITTMIDAPPGSGLGSSSALVVALLEAFRELLGLPLGRYDVAHIAFEIERLELELEGGKQDHYAAAFGGVNLIEFLPSDRVIVNPLRVADATLWELQSSIIICFTGRSRASGQIIKEQVTSVAEKDKVTLDAMHQLKSDAQAMKSALLVGDLAGMARVLDRSWQAKKSTAVSVSNRLIDNLWEVAHKQGAMAGKVSGAGGGGFMFFLVDPDDRMRVTRALAAAGGEPDKIYLTDKGAEAWTVGRSNGS